MVLQKNKLYVDDRKKDPEFTSVLRDRYYRSRYGVSLEQFNAMLNDQNQKCPICDVVLEMGSTERNRIPCLDHCHTTGQIRSILCWSCNSGLGRFMDSADTLITAVQYIKKHQGETSWQ